MSSQLVFPSGDGGAALLVAGFSRGDAPGGAASAAGVLGRVGETLLATSPGWRIRRLSAADGERGAPTRAGLRRHIDELAQQPVRTALLAITGSVVMAGGEPSLITGRLDPDYLEDATLPLSWIGGRLRMVLAERLVVVLSVSGGDPERAARPGELLERLATGWEDHVIGVHISSTGVPLVDALLAGLWGDALDRRTGSVTLASLGEHLARRVPEAALQTSPAIETFTSVPPLGTLAHPPRTRPSTLEPSDPADLVGVVLPGRFRIERPLGQGSFGVIYRARQLSVERDVAVKVLHPGVDPDSDDGRLFVAEIQAVGRIDHANVVRIFQADVTPGGRLFFAMELLLGRDLQQIVDAEAPLETDRAVDLTRQLLAGLAAVHEAGLVHSDIKPANTFVTAAARGGERLVLLDFGVARLRTPAGAESAGGTPAYMAPEQLHQGRVDARSDLFSVALVLVTLLTGWRRRGADPIVPPLDGIADAGLRAVLARALAVDPVERFQTAEDLSESLLARRPLASGSVATRPPFRHLASLTERDHAHLHGRDRDLAALTEHVLYRRALIYTAPSGVGKTSLLRAGLVPRLETLGARAVYLACRSGSEEALAQAIWPGALGVADAVATWHEQRGRKLVLIVDQLEAAFSEADVPAIVEEALGFDRWPVAAEVSVVLSVREDFLARLMSATRRLPEGVEVARLAPLTRDGARAAILGPLTEQRLTIEPALLEALLTDLVKAAAAVGVQMGWGRGEAVYPPHLQLACSVLYDSLPSGDALISLEHYRRLGGLDAIVGEYFDRVLDTEIDAASAAVARELFPALVTASQTRAFQTEAQLIEAAGAGGRVGEVLEKLRARGLVARVRAGGDEWGWELIHDSLVPRVLAWLDRRDLARRRAVELVRYHLRRSRPEAPSLLGRGELRELDDHGVALAELEADLARRGGDPGRWTPLSLVRRSRQVLRRRALALGGALAATLVAAGTVGYRSLEERSLRDRDLGRFALELSAFDWDPAALRATAVTELPALTWTLHEPDAKDPESPGAPVARHLVVRGPSELVGASRRDHVEARAGAAFLLVTGRDGDCAPSVVPLRRLPGYATREGPEERVVVHVPTCAATSRGMVDIAAGPFVHGGLGVPPALIKVPYPHLVAEAIVDLRAYRIDRTEVTNAAFALFAQLSSARIHMPRYPSSPGLADAGKSDRPVSGINWFTARAYCRFQGKDLPTSQQWEKAMRGALSPNQVPRRNVPWGLPLWPVHANLRDTGTDVAAVGSHPGDVSPDGVVDLAGNVQEWTDSRYTASSEDDTLRITRGGNWSITSADLVDYMGLENRKVATYEDFTIGFRCAATAANRAGTQGSSAGP